MRVHERADSVKCLSDEGGEYLVIETDDGDRFRFDLPPDVAKSLAFEQTLPIRLHWQEAEYARSTRPETVEEAWEQYDRDEKLHALADDLKKQRREK